MLNRRLLLATLTATIATLALASGVLAGGMATASLDVPPSDPPPNEPIQLGFTLLQHGVTPVDWGPTTLHVINTDTGERTSFDADPSGGPGHWVAEVTFPRAGSYTFEITHELEIQSINVAETVLDVQGAAASPAVAGPSINYALLAVFAGLVLMASLWFLGRMRSREQPVGEQLAAKRTASA